MTNEEKANLIVKELEEFSKKHLEVKIKGIERYPELVEIFLTGAWYGAVKAFESQNRSKTNSNNNNKNQEIVKS